MTQETFFCLFKIIERNYLINFSNNIFSFTTLSILRFLNQGGEEGRRGGLFWPFLKNEKTCPDLGKNCPDSRKKTLFVCIYGLNDHLKYKNRWRKNTKIFPCRALLLYAVHEKFIKVPPFQKTSPVSKNSWLRPCKRRKKLY